MVKLRCLLFNIIRQVVEFSFHTQYSSERRSRFPHISLRCQTVIFKEQMLTFRKVSVISVCVQVCVCVCIWGGFYAYMCMVICMQMSVCLSVLHSNLDVLCVRSMLFISVFICCSVPHSSNCLIFVLWVT